MNKLIILGCPRKVWYCYSCNEWEKKNGRKNFLYKRILYLTWDELCQLFMEEYQVFQSVIWNFLLFDLVASFWIVKCQTASFCTIIMKTSSCYWKVCAKFTLAFQVIPANLLKAWFLLSLQNIAGKCVWWM